LLFHTNENFFLYLANHNQPIMNKTLLSLCIFLLLSQIACSQQKNVDYGSNATAGKYYDVRGIKMYAETYGEGKPLLLIHGNGGSINAFSQTIPYFSKRYKVIAVDSRAHGKTVDSKDSLSFEMMADDFAALLDKMHIDSAYVIGWSDGGINALLLAMRHPDKVIKLASTGANLTPDSLGLAPSAWKDMVKQYQTGKDKPRTTAKEKNDWKIFMLDYVQPNIPFTALKAIKCPSLIICGDHDVIPIEHTTKIYQGIPRAYLWVVPNSGHPTLIEHRDEFNEVVNDFFEKPYHKF
jgi:pimeloyl-ACP methyl ester carboxylesterase